MLNSALLMSNRLCYFSVSIALITFFLKYKDPLHQFVCRAVDFVLIHRAVVGSIIGEIPRAVVSSVFWRDFLGKGLRCDQASTRRF